MKPLPDGAGTQRDALLSIQRQTGQHQKELDPPAPPPQVLLYLWEWFWQMSQGRRVGGMGSVLPIPPSEIMAWCHLTGIRLSRWEYSVIMALDAAFLRVSAER
jgi:hypothetical protein